MEERVIVASRGKISLHVIGAAVLLVASGYATRIPLDDPSSSRASGNIQLYGVVGVLFFGAALIASLVRFARPSRLTLRPDGLTIEQAFHWTRRLAWQDVETFYVGRPKAAELGNENAAIRELQTRAVIGSRSTSTDQKTVSYRFIREKALSSLAMGSDQGFGRDAALPTAEFPMSAEALVALLNEYRASKRLKEA
jgi:hypothetical protein